MQNLIITEHAKTRVLERIQAQYQKSFLRGMIKASKELRFTTPWCVTISLNNRIIGKAVGIGRTWQTVLRPGHQANFKSEFFHVSV